MGIITINSNILKLMLITMKICLLGTYI